MRIDRLNSQAVRSLGKTEKVAGGQAQKQMLPSCGILYWLFDL